MKHWIVCAECKKECMINEPHECELIQCPRCELHFCQFCFNDPDVHDCKIRKSHVKTAA